MKKLSNSQGSIIVSILIVTMFLTTLVLALVVISNETLFRAKARVLLLQAQYSAESGADAAIAQLNSGNTTYTGSGGEVTTLDSTTYRSTFYTTVAAGSDSKEKIITSTGYVYSPASSSTATYKRKIEVVAQQTSTNTSSSLLSRNIIDIASGVKNIWAVDVYVNGYINLNKNTTNLIAENITVAGKNTSASNCSIGGSGNLIKPSSFSDPSQTKTKITVAFNNCIDPPGNTSNTDFDVSANTSVSTIVSTYIPWNAYMDNTYINADSCTDWTTGTSPRTIPSTGNTKKTHYPDSNSNVSTACGNNGDLDLGSDQYNITDNVHLRANLCKADACNPTFYNPDSNIKFIFVEGTANFDSIHTASGSGPIVLITYGADPNTHGSACPSTDGDSLYLGQQGSVATVAPALYLLASNGLCVDQTKFDNTNPSLGGMSGKNLYIASNPGNPFDLKLDPSFPVNQIPVNLSWRAVRYRRL